MTSIALLGAEWVLWLLIGLSLVVAGVTIERVIMFLIDRSDSKQLTGAINGYLTSGDRPALEQKLEKISGFESRIIAAGLELADGGTEAAEKAMVGTATAEKLKMERGLAVIATIGSNAPFVGLFGTVLGIIQAFHGLAGSEEVSNEVMGAIAEALIATAVGLLVAIPAVVLYNGFSRWVKGRLGRSASLADLVLARLGAETGEARGE